MRIIDTAVVCVCVCVSRFGSFALFPLPWLRVSNYLSFLFFYRSSPVVYFLIMKIFKDIFSGDEMFSDTYKFKLVDGVLYEVYGKLITRKVGDVQLAGANPSAEEASEDNDEAVESGVDVVLNHRLMETYAFPDKKSFTLYLKEYMKRLVDKMVENGSTEVDVFKTNINKVMKDLLTRFKDLQFFTGENMDIENGMVAMLEYRDIGDDNVPVLMLFKHGLDEEKF